jgi:hypothetical protein
MGDKKYFMQFPIILLRRCANLPKIIVPEKGKKDSPNGKREGEL